MTWVKLSDSALDDPRLLALERGTVLLHIEALAFNNRHGLDGAIPRAALRKVTTEPDPEAAAASLVTAGLWTATESGWQLGWLLDDQPAAAEAESSRQAARRRQERHRRHVAGDHSLCDPKRCWSLLRVTRDATRNGTGDTTPPPSRPVPTRPEEEGRTGGGAGGARSRQAARAARREVLCFYCANPAPDGLELIDRGDGLLKHPVWDPGDDLPFPTGWEPFADEYGDLWCPSMPEGHDHCLRCLGAFPVDELRTDVDPLTHGALVTTACSPCWQVLEFESGHDCDGVVFDGPGRVHHLQPVLEAAELEPSGIVAVSG